MLKRCFHFGPSLTMEGFIQESGRIGRNGKQSTSILLYNSILQGHCSLEMKDFIGTKSCRREKCMSKFQGSYSPPTRMCLCCDLCFLKCSCGDCFKPRLKAPTKEYSCTLRPVSQDERSQVRGLLEDYSEQNFQKVRQAVKQVSLPIMYFEFRHFHINQIMENIRKIFTIKDVYGKIEIWRRCHAVAILNIFQEVFGDVEMVDNEESKQSHEISVEVDPNWFSIINDTSFQNQISESMFSKLTVTMEDEC
eukprot:TCONS_00002469-protein